MPGAIAHMPNPKWRLDPLLSTGAPMALTQAPAGWYDRGRAGANYTVPRAASVPAIGTESYEVAQKPWETANVMNDNSGHKNVNNEVRHFWGSATGTAGFHFPMVDDNIARHHASIQRLENLKSANRVGLTSDGRLTNASYGSYAGYNIIEHPVGDENRSRQFYDKNHFWYLNSLTSYELNAKRMVNGTQMSPPPEQAIRTHWLCQVNGLTNNYNIINNRAPNEHMAKHRASDVEKFDTFRKKGGGDLPYAGEIQPTPVVSCKDTQGFVPLLVHPPIAPFGRRNWDERVTGYVRRSIT
jgi:hypothetical protein